MKLFCSKNKKMIKYINKWFYSSRRSKATNLMFFVFMIVSVCLCLLADTPENKYATNVEYVYKINTCVVHTHTRDKSEFEEIINDSRVRDVVLDYSTSLPFSAPVDNPECELIMPVISHDKGMFKLSDRIKYGDYFNEENQVILSMEMAKNMSNNPESLIGTHINKNIYGLGNVELEIVGIFDYFNDIEKKYLQAMDIVVAPEKTYNELDYTQLCFVNNELINQLEKSEDFYCGGNQRGYILYFDNYKDMMNFCDDYEDVFKGKSLSLKNEVYMGNTYDVFKTMYMVLLPLAVAIMLFAIVFKISIVRTELSYNGKFISIFEYSGYSKRSVVNVFVFLNTLYSLLEFLIATAIAYFISMGINDVNRKYMFVTYQIFTYNYKIIFAYIIAFVSVIFIFTNVALRKIKYLSWYDNLVSQRDLI